MATISFPIEAFDEKSMKIDKIRPHVSFSFRQNLRDLCNDLEIPPTFVLEIDETYLNDYASKLSIEAHQRFIDIREELSIKYFNSSMTPGADIMSIASHEDKNILMSALKDDMNTPSTFQLQHVLNCYNIEVPDSLVEKYLMVKLAV